VKGRACTECGLRIDPAAGTTHPTCEPADPDAAQIRSDYREWIDAGMPAGGATLPQRALSIIRTAASRTAELDSNLCREAFDRAAIPGPLRGPAWARAVRAGYVEPVGHVASTGDKTNSHHVQRYRSLITRPTERKPAA
jgi:hypothetical protein